MNKTIERYERLSSEALEPGMYVAQLDIPWLGSPFSSKGFVIESQEELTQLRGLCREVVVDRAQSTGKHSIDLHKVNKAAIVNKTATVKALGHASAKVPLVQSNLDNSFVLVLKALRAGRDVALSRLLNAYPELKTTTVSEPQPASGPVVSKAMQRVKQWIAKSRSKADMQLDEDAQPARQYPPVEIELAAIYSTFVQAEEDVRLVFDAIAQAKHVDLARLHATLNRLLASIERQPDAMLWLARLRQSEGQTYNKALFVCINMMAFASFLSLSATQIIHLGLAGLLQDVGKVHIPVDILHKPGALSPDEFNLVKQHVQASIDTLRGYTNISEEVLQIVLQHHERCDGSGYPAQLEEGDISLSGQIAGIMDTYCAMTTDKPYARGLFSHEVLEELYLLSDEKFSETLVNQLIQFFGIYPVSSLVELNTGDVAVVIQQNHARRLQPRIMVIMDANRQRIARPYIINLMQGTTDHGGEIYKITRGVSSDDYDLDPLSDYF